MTTRKPILGLTIHRPEMVPVMAKWMQMYDTIILEEPPDTRFSAMLAGSITIDDYNSELDLEYPAFSHDMCALLRELNAAGKLILQVEPYLEVLLGIHNFFAEGNRPENLSKRTLSYPVYLAERNATGALLDFYQSATTGTFDEAVDALIKFTRLDAYRFHLRDSLRAQALAPIIRHYQSAFIEAGAIHFPMAETINREMEGHSKINTVFLTDGALQAIDAKGHLFGPGDRLTLLYRFHPNTKVTEQMRTLAARALIYAKLIEKQELTVEQEPFPHIRNELECIRLTDQFSVEDCRRLFPLMKGANSAEVRQIVTAYLGDTNVHTRLNRAV